MNDGCSARGQAGEWGGRVGHNCATSGHGLWDEYVRAHFKCLTGGIIVPPIKQFVPPVKIGGSGGTLQKGTSRIICPTSKWLNCLAVQDKGIQKWLICKENVKKSSGPGAARGHPRGKYVLICVKKWRISRIVTERKWLIKWLSC